MPKKHIYWIFAILCIFTFSAWCADPYPGTLRHILRLVHRHAISAPSERELFNAAVDGLLASIDENSGFIPPSIYEELNEEFHQETGTVGILFWFDEAKKQYRVGCTLPDSAAREAGIEPQDVLLSIDGEPLTSENAPKLLSKLHSQTKTQVQVETFRPSSQKKRTQTLVSRKLLVQSVTGFTRLPDSTWEYRLPMFPQSETGEGTSEEASETDGMPTKKTDGMPTKKADGMSAVKTDGYAAEKTEGKPDSDAPLYVRLETFGEQTARELREILTHGMQTEACGLVLDLRGNSGGLLKTALEICGMFVQKRAIMVQIVGKNARTPTVVPNEAVPIWTRPVAVLIDHRTASSAEIVAACLQDWGKRGLPKAVCIGSRTYGKGTIQNIFDLGPIPDDRDLEKETDWYTVWKRIRETPRRGGLRISSEMYLSPDGHMIHRFPNSQKEEEWGVQPNGGWECGISENPEFQKDPDGFEKRWKSLKYLRASGALPESRWKEIPALDLPLKRAIDFFQAEK